MNYSYSTSGFIKDAPYLAHIHSIIQEFNGQFGRLEKLHVSIEEIPYSLLNFERKPATVISEDGLNCTVNVEVHQYYAPNGKITGKPTPYEVFEKIRFLLKKASDMYLSKYQ